jgi:hypothetical protein
MATRKRARTDKGQFQGDDPATPEVNEAWVESTTADLAAFMALDQPDDPKLAQALQLARAAAAEFMGQPVPERMGHKLRMGVNLLASQLLLRNQLQGPVDPAAIPLVSRYYFRLAASAQG